MLNSEELRKQQGMYFNIKLPNITYQLDNCYNIIIHNNKVYDIAILKRNENLKNSISFIKEVANYSL